MENRILGDSAFSSAAVAGDSALVEITNQPRTVLPTTTDATGKVNAPVITTKSDDANNFESAGSQVSASGNTSVALALHPTTSTNQSGAAMSGDESTRETTGQPMLHHHLDCTVTNSSSCRVVP